MGDGITAEFDLGAIQCQYHIPMYSAKRASDVLLHDRKPQCIPQCMTLSFKLKRSSCLGGTGELSSLAITLCLACTRIEVTNNDYALLLHLQKIIFLLVLFLLLRSGVHHGLVLVLGVHGGGHFDLFLVNSNATADSRRCRCGGR